MPVTIEVALVAYIKTYPGLVPLLGDRIYVDLAPTQAALPYVVYTETGFRSERHMLGPSVLKWSSFRWEVMGTPHDQASTIRDFLITALDGLRGGFSGIGVSQGYIRDKGDMRVEDLSGGQQQIYDCWCDLDIVYYDPLLVDP